MPCSMWTTRSPRVSACKFGEEGVGILALLAADQPVAEHVLLGDQFQLVIGKAGVERQDQGHGPVLPLAASPALPASCRPAAVPRARFAEDRGDAGARCLRNRPRSAALLAPLGDGLEVRWRRLRRRSRRARARARNRGRRKPKSITFALSGWAKMSARWIGHWQQWRPVPRGSGRAHRVERAVGALRLARNRARAGVIIGNVGQPLLGGAERALSITTRSSLSEVIEQRGQPLLEQRQPVFHARQPPPVADRLVERVLRGIGAEHFAVAGAEALDAVLVEQRLAGGQQQVALRPCRWCAGCRDRTGAGFPARRRRNRAAGLPSRPGGRYRRSTRAPRIRRHRPRYRCGCSPAAGAARSGFRGRSPCRA
jgi:hypothetical protein